MKRMLVGGAVKKLMQLLTSALLCLLPLGMARAQGVGAAANIKGTVTDASGGVVPKATVVAEDTQKGIRHTAVTNDGGEYELTGLPPASYNVTVELSGFQTEILRGLVVTVGQTAVLDFRLKMASEKTTVEVSADPPVVETERGSQADTLTQNYIKELPIDRRDYLTLTLLAPGVSNSTRIADDQDYRVKQEPQSGLSFYGSNGRGNSVTIDGGEANDDAGSVRLTLSQDAVQEFQINRSNYGAELGGGSGGSINIVSKSGGNEAHGSLYGFFRNDAMDARDPFAFSSALAPDPTFANFNTTSTAPAVKNSLNRQQYGGTAGFPIKKDKTFLFGAFEGLRQDSQNAVPLLTDSSIFAPQTSKQGNDQQTVLNSLAAQGSTQVQCFNSPGTLPANVCAALLTSALTINPNAPAIPGLDNPALDGFLVSQYENNGGLFKYNTREYLGSARLDHRFSDYNQIYLRYNYGHDLEQSPDVQSLTGFSRGSSLHVYNHTLQSAWFHLFSPTTQNEARVQFSYNSSNVIPNEPGEVGLDIAGFGNLGTNIFLPNLEILRRYDFADNVSMTRGHHSMKFGGEELLRGNHSQSAIFFPGRFVFGPLPGAALSPQLASVQIDSLQAVALAQPIFLQDGFGNPIYAYTRPWTAAYWQDSWAIRPNLTLNYGVRYELDTQYAPLNTPKHNFAPRVSFAWDPFKDHKTVIRGGYGIFYSQIYDAIPGVDQVLGVLNANKSAVENQGASGPGSQIANVVGTCGIAGVLPGSGASPCNRPISILVDPINLATLAGNPAFAAFNSNAVFNNLFNCTNGVSENCGAGAPGVIGCTTPAVGVACITPADLIAASSGFFNPTHSGGLPPLSVLFVNQPNYRSPYAQQAEFGIEREFARGLSVSLSGIYSHTIGLPVAIDTNLQDPGFVTATLANGKTVKYHDWNAFPQFDPLGQTSAKCDPAKGGSPSNCFYNPFIVQNNQYTAAASALYEGGILEIKKRFSDRVSLLGSYTYSKAFDTTTDFNSDYGPQDPLNLGADRALSSFDERHKVVVAGVFGSPWKKGILSGFQLSPIFNYHSGHPFNLLSGEATNGDNHPTNGRPIGAPRNSGLGPNYVDFDMRLSWQHKVAEKAALQFTAEGFNIANRTNFASVNNVVGPLFGFNPGFTTFNVHGSSALSPSAPLGFTSAFPKREIQLGLRFTF